MSKFNSILSLLCMVVSGASVLFMAAIAFVDSIGRPLGHPLAGGSEYVQFSLLLFFYSSLPLMVEGNSHIRVGLLADFYRRGADRAERIVTMVLETLALAVLAWMVFDQALRLTRSGAVSVYFEQPVAPYVFVAGAFTAIAVWFAVCNGLKAQDRDDTRTQKVE